MEKIFFPVNHFNSALQLSAVICSYNNIGGYISEN